MELFKQEMELFCPSDEIATDQQMILGFEILSLAVFSPKIWWFKGPYKFGTFALDFVPSYDQSGEREP